MDASSRAPSFPRVAFLLRRGRAKYRDFLITARKVAAIFSRSVLTTIGIQGWRTDTKASP